MNISSPEDDLQRRSLEQNIEDDTAEEVSDLGELAGFSEFGLRVFFGDNLLIHLAASQTDPETAHEIEVEAAEVAVAELGSRTG